MPIPLHAAGCACHVHAPGLFVLADSSSLSPHLETVARGLNQAYDAHVRLAALWSECRKNAVPEAVCISVCEGGEFASELAAYGLGLPFMNEIGLAGGLLLGGAYAVSHVYRHAREHHAHASLTEAAAYAASTESGCVISAAGAEYVAGKTFTSGMNPLTPENLAIRGASLPVAFGIGLLVMSAFTYFKRDEAARFIARKGRLQETGEILNRHLEPHGVRVLSAAGKIELKGSRHSAVLEETKLPRTYQKDFSSEEYALLKIASPVARWDAAFRDALTRSGEISLKKSGARPRTVSNPYACTGHEKPAD